MHRAFPEPNRPDYLTSEEFLKYTPTEDFMSLPGEILRTEFRLVVTREVTVPPTYAVALPAVLFPVIYLQNDPLCCCARVRVTVCIAEGTFMQQVLGAHHAPRPVSCPRNQFTQPGMGVLGLQVRRAVLSAPPVGLAQGWEYTVLERELGAHRDPLRKMLVTVSVC